MPRVSKRKQNTKNKITKLQDYHVFVQVVVVFLYDDFQSSVLLEDITSVFHCVR